MDAKSHEENAGEVIAPEKNISAAPVILISASMLMFEILQTITLSLQLFDRIAFLVVSFSMIGLGAGGTLGTLLLKRGKANPSQWLWGSTISFGLLVIICMAIGSRLDNLTGIILVSFLPYIPVGLFLSFMFYFWPRYTHRNYFLNLLGSGLGCLTLMAILNLYGDAALTIWTISGIAILGSIILASNMSKKYLAASIILFVGIASLQPIIGELIPFSPSKEKHYGQILSNPAIKSQLDWTKWGFLGRMDSVVPGDGIELFNRTAKKVMEQGSDFRYLFASGDNWSYTIDFRQNELVKKEYARKHILAIPYLLTKNPDVLNIGLGGGVDVFLALYHGSRSVVGVEINPLMIEAVKVRHRGFFDDPFNDPRVTIKEMDGRTFVNNTNRTFDVITLSAVDTGAGLAFGGNMLSENYLYTGEAFDKFFRALNEKGFFLVFRPKQQLLRSILTAIATMRTMGIQHPERHFAVFGDNVWQAALFSRSPLTDIELEQIISLVQANSGKYNIYYLPGENHISLNYAVTPIPLYGQIFDYIARNDENSYINNVDNISLDVSPVYDDSPYFYNQERNFFVSRSFRHLFIILAIVSVFAFVFILLPLKIRSLEKKARDLKSLAGYFSGIGIGFMFIEIGLIQKLILFLGHPSYSITVTLFSILIFSGLGSIFSGGLKGHPEKKRFCIFSGIIIAAICYAFIPARWLGFFYTESLIWRCIIAAILLAPGSFVMGMPFPTMLSTLNDSQAEVIPLAYAMNSFASVVASIVAIIISMSSGFTSLFLFGAAFYLLAFHLSRHQIALPTSQNN